MSVREIEQEDGNDCGDLGDLETTDARSVEGDGADGADPADLVGMRIDRYLVTGVLGCGTQGMVYRARHTVLHREVALKVFEARSEDELKTVERLRREGIAGCRVDHPNIPVIYDASVFGRTVFLAMELIEGRSLREWLQHGPIAAPIASQIGMRIADALASLHRKGIIHRDVTPNNVMIANSGEVKLLDFGYSKIGDAAFPLSDQTRVVGTLAYMAPEYLRAGVLDHRADLYSLGLVLYEMMAGFHPQMRKQDSWPTEEQLIAGRLKGTDQPPPLTKMVKGVPSELSDIVARAMAQDPAARFPDAASLRDALVRAWRTAERASRCGRVQDIDPTDADGVPVVSRIGPRKLTAPSSLLGNFATGLAAAASIAVLQSAIVPGTSRSGAIEQLEASPTYSVTQPLAIATPLPSTTTPLPSTAISSSPQPLASSAPSASVSSPSVQLASRHPPAPRTRPTPSTRTIDSYWLFGAPPPQGPEMDEPNPRKGSTRR